MVDLSVVIVNYNSGEYLARCLKSLKKVDNEANLETFVVDNASTDDSLVTAKKNLPKVKLIDAGSNLGFAKANNIALSKIKTEYVLILNPDTEIKKGTFKRLIDVMEDDLKIGAISPKVILDNGEIDWASHRGFPTPWASFLYFLGNDSLYHLSYSSMNSIHQVDAISGAFFLTRKSLLEKVGFFDEDYFMYGEDLDLCYRIKMVGYKVMYIPEVSIIHHKGISSGLKKDTQNMTSADLKTRQRSVDAFYGSMKIFYKKHLEKNYSPVLNCLVYLGINLKWWLSKKRLVV